MQRFADTGSAFWTPRFIEGSADEESVGARRILSPGRRLRGNLESQGMGAEFGASDAKGVYIPAPIRGKRKCCYGLM